MAFRNKGLLLGTTRVEVQDVKPAHRKECTQCKEIPVVRRLAVTEGSARSQHVSILCVECGRWYLGQLRIETARAMKLLRSGELPSAVRMDSIMRRALKPKTKLKDED